MNTKAEQFEFACERLGETDSAVKILDHSTGEEMWIPLSQVDEMHFDKNDHGTIIMTRWIARKKGLI